MRRLTNSWICSLDAAPMRFSPFVLVILLTFQSTINFMLCTEGIQFWLIWIQSSLSHLPLCPLQILRLPRNCKVYQAKRIHLKHSNDLENTPIPTKKLRHNTRQTNRHTGNRQSCPAPTARCRVRSLLQTHRLPEGCGLLCQ